MSLKNGTLLTPLAVAAVDSDAAPFNRDPETWFLRIACAQCRAKPLNIR